MGGRQRSKRLPQEPIQLSIIRLSHEGRGIANHEGKVVFVDGALPTETVEARFTASKGSYAEASTLKVLNTAPERAEAPCRYYGVCGGCSLQHMNSQAQLAFKDALLHERLAHAVGADKYQRLPVISGDVLGYRRKARLAVRWVGKKGKALVGFREQQSSFITDMDECVVLDARVATLLGKLSVLISNLDAREQLPQVEVAIGDKSDAGSGDCALVFRHLAPLSGSDQVQLKEFGLAHGIDIYLQPKGPDSVHRFFPETGAARLFYALPEFGLTMAFHPLDFTQVNAGINRKMLSQALALLDLNSEDRVLDLFCGLGNFTLPIARTAREVVGVEGSIEMVERGKENAKANGLENVEFHAADLTRPAAEHDFLRKPFTKILLDPPRSGAQEVLAALTAMKPERIVYVSCNPATLARDAAILSELGFTLHSAGAMDMFPHTGHVEAMALFVPARSLK